MSSANTRAIKRVPIDSLYLDPADARLHPEQNLDGRAIRDGADVADAAATRALAPTAAPTPEA